LALTGAARHLLRVLLRAHLEREPEDVTASALIEIMANPVEPGELAQAFGPGDPFPASHTYGAAAVTDNGGVRRLA